MNLLDTFVKTVTAKDDIQRSKDITGSMRLVDLGVITRIYKDGTCDITCIKKGSDGKIQRYHGIEVLYPCGFKNIQNSQLCLIVNPYSSIYRTENLENPDFIGDHDQRCMKAIPMSNNNTDIFTGIDNFGSFNVSNKSMGIVVDKWSMYLGTFGQSSDTSVYLSDDGTVIMNASKGHIHVLIHPDEGLGFVHYSTSTPMKALEALVLNPNGEKYSLYFCSEVFTFTKISDILDIGKDKWKRIEYTDTSGVLTVAPGDKWSGADRHLATSEDLKLLWDAFKEHTHQYTAPQHGAGLADTAAPITTLTTPKKVAGIVVKDGDNA